MCKAIIVGLVLGLYKVNGFDSLRTDVRCSLKLINGCLGDPVQEIDYGSV